METLELTAADIAALARPYISKTTIGDVTLAMEEDGIRWDGYAWQIPVWPSRPLEKRYLYEDAIVALNLEMEAKEGLRFLLVSARPLLEAVDTLFSGAGPCEKYPRLSYEEMSQASRKMTAAEVAARVRPYIAKTTLDDIPITLVEAHIRLEFDFWRVPIRPARATGHRSRYVEELIDLEEEMQECEGFFLSIDDLDPLDEE